MQVESWLDASLRDADRRGLPDLRPLLEALARATSALRAAAWNVALDEPGSLDAPDGSGAPAVDAR